MRISERKGKLLTRTAIIVLLSAAFLVLCGSSRAGTDNTVSISVPVTGMKPAKIQQVTGNQAVINIGEFPQGGSPGDPALPYKSITLLVPPNADLEKLSAGLVSESWEELPGEYEIAPVKPAAASNGERVVVSWGNKDKSLIVDGKDTSIYGSDAYFPSVPVQIVSVGKFRQFKLVELRVWLAAYNPVQKKVRVLKDAQASLTVQKLAAGRAVGLDSAVLPKFPKTEKFKAQLRQKIANPQDIDAFYSQQSTPAAQGGGPAPSNVTADYVIITTNTIVNTSTKLANFIAAKQVAGFTVNTVTEAPAAGDSRYIEGINCEQRAENIRGWLQAHDLNFGIEYVLLIGQPDPCQFTANQSVPMKMCWPRNHQSFKTEDDIKCPTDMYFAELSGNWDRDGNGICGEFYNDYGPGGADKYCEIKVGRIPVYNANYADLDAILQKCIDYGNTPGGIGWRSKVLIPAAISNFGPEDTTGNCTADLPFLYTSDRTFGADWGEAIKSRASTISFSPYTLYEKQGVHNDGSAYPLTACNAALNNANVINEWKNHYGFVTWWAHGSQSSASRLQWTLDNVCPNLCNSLSEIPNPSTTFIDWSDSASLDNNYPSFVVQVSCDNGYPENTINLGYYLLKQGAIGTISGTRTTWYRIGSWDTGAGASVGDNASYGYYCFDRMANSAETIGTALVWCRANFGTGWTDGMSWMNMVGFNLYGDPSLSLNLPPGCVKWEQQPDTGLYEGSYGTGVDIRFDRSDGFNRLLADDFMCTQTGPIHRVKLWGSWHNDVRCQIKKIHLSIHNDKPAPEQGGMSEPNTLLWSKDINAADINETLYYTVPEWWWDPYTSMVGNYPGDTQIWQYDINIPYHAFVQQGDSNHPIIYWLDAYAELDPMDPNFPMAQFGWKTSSQHWNDDSVWFQWNQWNELRYPSGHPNYYESIDLAFGIYSSNALYPYYVDVCATGNNDGTSWTDAYNFLQDALAQADAQLIFVADGTYKPDQGGGNTALDKNASFVLRKGVAIYGGFAGVGAPDPNARNVRLYQTILSGDLAGDDVYVADPCNFLTEPTRAENSYHVVKGGNTNRTAILDGFTIMDGNANSGAWPNGGGMLNDNDANCIVNNCTFVENSSGGGGAMFNNYSNLLVSNCTFYRNSGTYGGGGIVNYLSSPTLVNCTFVSNKGVDPTSNGGGIYNIQDCNPAMMNCLFSDNSAVWGGAMANIHASNPTIANCTFANNVATGGGCGAINDYNNCAPTIVNGIFWNNTSPQIGDSLGSAATVNYSDVQGGWGGAGVGNINTDPQFVNADGPDGVAGTLDDNLRLLSNSPCIDKGSNAGVSLDTADIDRDGNTVERTPLDLDLRPRVADGNCDGNSVVDMGAYEFSYAYAGDFDSDCNVDFSDFALLASSWLQSNPSVDIAPPPAGDGIIDIKDLAVLCDNWLAGK